MSPEKKLTIASLYTFILLALGASDAALTAGQIQFPASTGSSATSSSGPVGVQRNEGPDVFGTLNALGIVTQSVREESILRRIIPKSVAVESRVLLKNDDRLAFFSVVESPDVKVYFTALKDSLHSTFSSELTDLVDEVQDRPGKPVRNVLSFLDPAIHEERLLFVRVRQRLFEFHVPAGKEEEIQTVMDALTE